MNHEVIPRALIGQLEDVLASKITHVELPAQGMSSRVFCVVTQDDRSYAVKYSEAASREIAPLQLIAERKVPIPTPALVSSFRYEAFTVVVLSWIVFPLLESVPVSQMARYVPSMLGCLRTLHTITSTTPGLLGNAKASWKGVLVAIFSGEDFDWQQIAQREVLDSALVSSSVARILGLLRGTTFAEDSYSLLHTDFNQRNLFVDPTSCSISGIIDWEEAMFGDPLYDFARIRMYLWHFKLGAQAVEKYKTLLQFSPQQQWLETLYWLIRVIQYLAWYSEKQTPFNLERIALHQEFLRDFNWERFERGPDDVRNACP